MGRNRLDPYSETTNDTFRLPSWLKRAFRDMCSERGKNKAEVYRKMMEREVRLHLHMKRLKTKSKGAA